MNTRSLIFIPLSVGTVYRPVILRFPPLNSCRRLVLENYAACAGSRQDAGGFRWIPCHNPAGYTRPARAAAGDWCIIRPLLVTERIEKKIT